MPTSAGTSSIGVPMHVLPDVVWDPATMRWIAAVIANGGTVSPIRRVEVNNLIQGLKTDGIFTNLDRLWLFASENSASALVDIITTSLATNNNSTTFTANRGYTGDGISMFIDSNFNPTVGSPHFVQNSACIFGWNNTPGTDSTVIFGATVVAREGVYPAFSDGTCYFGINDPGLETVGPAPSPNTGLFVSNRTAVNADTLDLNGVQIFSGSNTSSAPGSNTFTALVELGGPNFSTRQICCFGFGGALSVTDRQNLYNRLRIYMTAVRVP